MPVGEQTLFANVMKTALLFMMLAVSATQLLAEEPKPDPPTIKLFSDESTDEEGLLILLKQKDYPGVKTEKIEFEIQIVNRLLEEVFVEVTELGDAHMCFDGGMMGWSGIAFPDNRPLLKRLHAATMSGKKKVTCGCGSVVVKQSREHDLSKFVGRVGTLCFQAKGFYRNNGKAFSETIDLKFKIIDPSKSESEQAGADQPATKPADKAPVKDQPTTPTPKDSPR